MNEQNALDNQETTVKTYRFKISNCDLYEEMILFADKNRFLNKKDLKETYEKWIEEPNISLLIRAEEEMLKLNQYNLGKNNIKQKIFKSIKYYHIKKLTSKTPKTQPKPKNKKKEVSFSKELLECVKQILQNHTDLKPSQYYEQFVIENNEILEREKGRLGYEKDDTSFEIKLKKMMKNQYYMKFQK